MISVDNYVILSYKKQWHSTPVNKPIFEGGAKNPSKGTSMKFLVLAADAQSGVSSESKEMGAIHKGMWALTLASRRPTSIFKG